MVSELSLKAGQLDAGWSAPTPPRPLDPQMAQNHTQDMVSLKFAILKSTKHLNRAGLPPQQAEAISEAFAKATGAELVTKRDYSPAPL